MLSKSFTRLLQLSSPINKFATKGMANIHIKGQMDNMGFGAQNFMKVLDQEIDKESDDYLNNYEAMMALNNKLEGKI